MEYKHVGTHTENLADGRMFGPGETVELDEDQIREPENERLLAEGIFIGLEDKAEHEKTLAERRVARRTARAEEGGEEE